MNEKLFAGLLALAHGAGIASIWHAARKYRNDRLEKLHARHDLAQRTKSAVSEVATEWTLEEFALKLQVARRALESSFLRARNGALDDARAWERNVAELQQWRRSDIAGLVEPVGDIMQRSSSVAVLKPAPGVSHKRTFKLASALSELTTTDLKLLQSGCDPAAIHELFGTDAYRERLRQDTPGITDEELDRKVDARLSTALSLSDLPYGEGFDLSLLPGLTEEQRASFTLTLAAEDGRELDPGARAVVFAQNPGFDLDITADMVVEQVRGLQESAAHERREPIMTALYDARRVCDAVIQKVGGGDLETAHERLLADSEYRGLVEWLEKWANDPHRSLADLAKLDPETHKEYQRLTRFTVQGKQPVPDAGTKPLSGASRTAGKRTAKGTGRRAPRRGPGSAAEGPTTAVRR